MACPPVVTQQMLDQAVAAYHKLMTGTAVVEVTDQNGERVRFQSMDSQKLYNYIQILRSQLCIPTPGVRPVNGPASFLF